MDRLIRLRRSSVAGLAVVAVVLTSACDSPVEITAFEPPLDTMACEGADLPSNFSWQTGGTFTVEDLAGVADDPDARGRELRDAGVRAGYFSNWRQTVSRPPFDPPVDVTCQVIAFEDPTQAETFVEQLIPGTGAVASAAVSWLQASERGVTEVDGAGGGPPGARVFRIEATDAGVAVVVHMTIFTHGPFVQAVLAGGEGDDGASASREVALALAERTARLVQDAER